MRAANVLEAPGASIVVIRRQTGAPYRPHSARRALAYPRSHLMYTSLAPVWRAYRSWSLVHPTGTTTTEVSRYPSCS
jgi:hypothetical protein